MLHTGLGTNLTRRVLSSDVSTTRALHYVGTRVVLAKRVPADRTIGWHGPHNRWERPTCGLHSHQRWIVCGLHPCGARTSARHSSHGHTIAPRPSCSPTFGRQTWRRPGRPASTRLVSLRAHCERLGSARLACDRVACQRAHCRRVGERHVCGAHEGMQHVCCPSAWWLHVGRPNVRLARPGPHVRSPGG